MVLHPEDETLKQIMFHMPLFGHVFLIDPRDFFKDYPDIKPSHIHALMFLKVNGETTMTRLAGLLRLEKGSLTSVAERLVSAGLVERQTDPADRRKSVLRLTRKGRKLAEAFRTANADQYRQRIGRLSTAEQAEFLDCLMRMNELMRRMLEPGQLMCPHVPLQDLPRPPNASPEPDAPDTE